AGVLEGEVLELIERDRAAGREQVDRYARDGAGGAGGVDDRVEDLGRRIAGRLHANRNALGDHARAAGVDEPWQQQLAGGADERLGAAVVLRQLVLPALEDAERRRDVALDADDELG